MNSINKNQKIILLIVIAVAALYSALWYGYAAYLKANITHAINNDVITLKYDSVDIGGFPLTIKMKFHNFSIHSKTGKLVDDVLAGLDPSAANKLKVPVEKLRAAIDKNWVDQVIYEQFMVETNLLATRYYITHSDKSLSKSIIDGESFAYESHRVNPNFIVQFSKSPLLVKQGSEDRFLAILSSITSMKISMGAGKTLQDGTKDIMSSSEGAQFLFNIARIDQDRHRIEVKLATKDTVVTKVSNGNWERLLKLPSLSKIKEIPELKKVVDRLGSVELWRKGKSNSDFHIVYTGTTNKEAFSRQDVVLNMEILKFNSSDDLSTTQTEGSLAITSNKQAVNGRMVLHGATKINQKWYDYKLEDLKSAQNNQLSDFSSTPLAEKFSIPVLIKHMDKIIPKLQDFGTIKYDIDVGFDREKQALDIKQLDVISDLYSTKITGNKDASNKVAAKVSLVNFRRLVDDIVDYYVKMRPIIDEASLKPLEFTIAPEIREALKLFLIRISDTPAGAGDNIDVSIQVDKSMMPTIGTLQMQEAVKLAQRILFPLIVIKDTPSIAPTPQKP